MAASHISEALICAGIHWSSFFVCSSHLLIVFLSTHHLNFIEGLLVTHISLQIVDEDWSTGFIPNSGDLAHSLYQVVFQGKQDNHEDYGWYHDNDSQQHYLLAKGERFGIMADLEVGYDSEDENS